MEPEEVDGVLDAADLAPTADPVPTADPPTEVLAVDELDIEWEAEGFYGAAEPVASAADEGAGVDEEAPAPGDFVEVGDLAALDDPAAGEDDVVLDAASLAPDPWEGDEAPPVPGTLPTGDVEAGDLLMELADLAPDIEPGSRPEDDDHPDEVLPTRTLGELYARQGLIDEAVKVFEELVRHDPSDSDLRLRLAELRAEAAPAADDGEEDARPDEPSITQFLERLLAWESTPRDGEADAP